MKIKNIKKFLIIFSFISSVILLGKLVIIPKKTKFTLEEKNNCVNNHTSHKKHIITVFIHGTILPYPSYKVFKKALKNQKNQDKKSFYSKYLKNLRYELIYKLQPISDFGLLEINEDNTNGERNLLIAKLYKFLCKYVENDNNILFSFYTFGWDGRLDSKKREEWGNRLYKELIDKIEELKKKMPNIELIIHVLAHSHGGNVALNLSKSEEILKKGLVIDKLVLFGTPIQSETSGFINSDVFKYVYNIYSKSDPVQVVDIISTKDSFSKRRFSLNLSKLKQIEIEVGKKGPLHNELWFLKGKDNFLYRKKFGLNPFPVSIFTPLIVNFIDSNFSDTNNIELNIKKEGNDLKFIFHDFSYSFTNFENLKKQIPKKLV
ncbi:hypothetical protein KAT08_00700 [Candidatus Babeliales bacterium]|nr:hypothetical protein [Candidatus Babeliales bacterium]